MSFCIPAKRSAIRYKKFLGTENFGLICWSLSVPIDSSFYQLTQWCTPLHFSAALIFPNSSHPQGETTETLVFQEKGGELVGALDIYGLLDCGFVADC